MVVLHKLGLDACLTVSFLLVSFHEEAARIAEKLWFYDQNVWIICVHNFHG
jgi:hypothetical protein